MAEESIILDIQVDTGKSQRQLASVLTEMQALKAEQKALKDATKEAGKVDAEQAARLAEIETAMKANKATAKALTAEINQLTKSGTQYGDSLNEMRRYLGDLQARYDGLSKAERENANIGGVLQQKIKEQHEAVLELEGSTGRMQRNVGNYSSAVTDLIPGMSQMNAALSRLGVSFDDVAANAGGAGKTIVASLKSIGKAFITPPIAIIAAIVGAIVLVVNKLKEAFNRSDDAGTALAAGLATLKPIGTAIGKIFENLANFIGRMVEQAGKAAIAIAELANKVGIGDGEFVRAANSAQGLVHAIDDLEEAERNYTKNAAIRERDIAKLRVEAQKTTDPKKRKELLDQVVKLEEANLADRQKILEQRVKTLKEQARQEVDTSDETKNKIAEAEAELARAEEESYQRRIRITSQLRTAREQAAAAAKQRADKEIEIAATLQQKLIDGVKDEGMRELLQTQLNYDKEIAALKKRLKVEKDLTEQARKDITALIALTEQEKEAELATITQRQVDERLAQTEAQEKRIMQLRLDLAAEGSEEERELRLQMAQLEFDESISALELSNEEKVLLEQKYLQTLAEINDEYRKEEEAKEVESLDQRRMRQANAAADYADAMGTMLSAASGAFGELAALYDEDAENNAEAKKKKRAFAATSIALNEASVLANTATSIAAAVAAASEASVFTGPAAPVALVSFIASMTAAVVSAIAGTASTISQARELLKDADAGAYAGGGVVGGTSYSGDRLTANVNSGEMILNREQQSRLFNIANGQGGNLFDYSMMADVMAAAVAALPAPVMEYSEFKAFTKRIAQYDEFAKL